jgi:hypothetical protein
MSVNETAGARLPNRFMADLTQAMRSTAETARQATIEQCQADAKGYIEQLHSRTDDEAASLRKAAEADVSAIRDWSKAEMERIRVETEQRIARRRELLEQELQEYNAAIELEIERVQKRVTAFEEEVAQFFEQLLQEADPTVFASMAAQMPDPPAFTASDRGTVTADLKARRDQIMRPAFAPPAEQPAQQQQQQQQQPAQQQPAPAAPAQEQASGSNGTQPAAATGGESAAASVAAAKGQPGKSGPVESTQVVVMGLVSVATIASFKRQLGKLPGIKSVGVSSGPDGEFIFTVSHNSDAVLSQLIPTLPQFQARITNEREGVLTVSAHDPEAEG